MEKQKKSPKLSPKKPTKLLIETDDLNKGFECLEIGNEGEFDHKRPNIPNCLNIARSKYLQDKPQNPSNCPFLTTRLNDQITQKKRMPSPLTSPHKQPILAYLNEKLKKPHSPTSHIPTQTRIPPSPPPTTTPPLPKTNNPNKTRNMNFLNTRTAPSHALNLKTLKSQSPSPHSSTRNLQHWCKQLIQHGISPVRSPTQLNRKYFKIINIGGQDPSPKRFSSKSPIQNQRDERVRQNIFNQYLKERQIKQLPDQENKSKERSQGNSKLKEENGEISVCNEGTVCLIFQITSRFCFSPAYS
jgi:hypothetical protein